MTRGKLLTLAGAVVLIGVGLTALMAARGDKDAPNAGSSKPASSRLVCMGEVETGERMVHIFPENFPMPSRVVAVLVKEGALVKKGQPLLEFDIEMLSLKVQEAERGIAEARFVQTKAEAGVREHAWKTNSAEKKWKAKEAELAEYQNDLKEAQRLFKLDAYNKAQLESAEKKVQAAEYNLEAAKIELDGLRADVPSYYVDQAKAAIKRLETLKAQAERAQNQMACKAPADGRIVRSFVSDGHTFHPTSRDPAFWFLKDGPLIVRAEVTQEFARRVVLGKAATIEDEADSQQTWKGRVSKISDQFLPKRQGGTTAFDFMPVSDDRVLECQISIDLAPGEAGPKYGQKVRISLE